jgi:RPA family protein
MLPSQAVSFHEDEITVTLGQAHDIAVGDLVSLQVGEKGTLVEVVEVPSLATFVAKGWEGEPVSEVLVFGRMVDDLRSVNYDAISMLNVSATQELARRVEALEQAQERLAQVQAENSELRSQNERLMGLLEEMQQLREEVEGVRATCATQEEL